MAAVPGMAEPINFKFLWKEDHLSDYVLVICSEPEVQPLEGTQHAASYPNATGSFGQQGLQHAGQQQQHPEQGRLTQNAPWRPQQQGQAATASTPLGRSRADREQRAVGTAAAAAAAAGATRQRRKRNQHQQAASTAVDAVAGPRTRAAKRQRQAAAAAVPEVKADIGSNHEPVHAVAAAAAAVIISNNLATGRHANQQVNRGSKRTSSKAPSAAAALDTEDGSDGDPPSTRRQQRSPAPANAAQSPESLRLSIQGLMPRRSQDVSGAAAAAAAAAVGSQQQRPGSVKPAQQQQQQQQQQTGQAADETGGGSSLQLQLSPTPAAGPSQPALVVHAELPVHGAVLSAVSEYFRALIQNWQGTERRLQMLVAEDEARVAEALVEFMYTGELPRLGHEDMLRLMRLSDRFQVKNCPAACARRFADTPMEELSLDTVCAIFDWPGFLQEAQPFAGVSNKAWLKLLDMFGDLELAWQDLQRRQQFLELPFKAVRKLFASDQLAVVSENTVLVALAGWIEAHNRLAPGAGSSGSSADGWMTGQQLQQVQQQRELAELVRLQHLSPAFLGSVLKRVPIVANVASQDALMAAARYAAANEATRNKLHSMPNRIPRMSVLYGPPRSSSAVQRLQFEWILELSTVKSMIAQFKNTKVTVDRYSEPHYFNGFQWQLVLQVLEPPAKPQANNQIAPSSVDVFVGTTARIQIGSSTHLPDVLYFRGQLAAREVASGEFTFLNRMESGFVCGTAGWGFRNFLRITDWENESALRRFFYDGKIHLRCNIDQCE